VARGTSRDQERKLCQQGQFGDEQHPLPQTESAVQALRGHRRLTGEEHREDDAGEGDTGLQAFAVFRQAADVA
jgi:hypothetical protein